MNVCRMVACVQCADELRAAIPLKPCTLSHFVTF